MSDLDTLVQLARIGDEPGAADRERVRRRLAALALPPVASASAAPWLSAIAGKKLLLATIGAAAVTAGAFALRPTRSPDGRAPAPAVTAALAPAPTPAVAPVEAAFAHDPPSSIEGEVARNVPDLEAEVAALSAVKRALSRGDGQRAWRMLRRYDDRFPTGALYQERAVAAIAADCLIGQEARARARSRSFLARWPDSPLAARVRRGCPVP